jgi:hypothetical protein
MPLFMDIHKHVDGLTAEAAAEAHAKNLEIQKSMGSSISVIGMTKKQAGFSAS